MKQIKNIVAASLLLLIGVSFNACVKDNFDTPPFNVPTYDGPDANTTIADLKAGYAGFYQITDDVVITGVINANDESGNIYKSLFFQDATGGIEMKINQTNLFNTYRVGQRVYVKCKDLFLGDYGGQIQLGYIYNGAIGQIPEDMLKDYLFLDSLPGKAPAPVVIENIGDLSVQDYTSMLLQFDNASFPTDAGLPWTNATDVSATNRTMSIDGGNITVRTSVYSSFKNAIIPSGTGTVLGIYTKFNSAPQLILRDTSDLKGFPPPLITILNAPFATDQANFTSENVSGDQVWTLNTSGKYMSMSGLVDSVNHANEDWLISPALSLASVSQASLAFDHTISKGPTKTVSQNYMKEHQTVWISTDYSMGNPNSATWTKLEYTTFPSGTNWLFVNATIAIPGEFIGKSNVRIAFKYTCDDTDSAVWRINNVKVTGSK